ncbi:uncharacterized protein BDW43DRAFT_239171 [Aspergillus alliaceus]|uniref:uncharacterized protein n=1 Tax=Petromyces alliaceus TaxID=209559 RepID=UPI0012A776C8|nr:uncharacterized protein BDW43DRAFT_239171 [Aspergillus alliaceus]KAB8236421.1 hypothetical protein BDW43DRAFT_239171 [Aspergillus alliaceus]
MFQPASVVSQDTAPSRKNEDSKNELLGQPSEEGSSAKEGSVGNNPYISPEENELDQKGEEHFASLLAHGRYFLVESNAFGMLREGLRNFVHPPYKQTTHLSRAITAMGYSESSEPAPALHLNVLAKISRTVMSLLSSLGLKEKAIQPGYQRIRWMNAHGKWLYDDYIEHDAGALHVLQNHLNTLMYQTETSTEGDNGHSSSHSSRVGTPNRSSAVVNSSNTGGMLGELHDASADVGIGSAIRDVELGESPHHTFHLLLCEEMGRYGVELHQLPVTHIMDDRQFFCALQRVYYEHRGRFKPFWSLRTVRGIHFMKFTYGGHRYIDVRCHEDLCEKEKPCDCVPPGNLVHPNGTEYEFCPLPPKLSPPFGPRMMMDLFTYPNCIKPSTTLVVQQLPKRTCGELQSEYIEMKEAWGIYYKEDWDWTKIWWILGVGFFPPSLIFREHLE